MKKGDIAVWINGDKRVMTLITNTKKYRSFKEMLIKEGIENVLPPYDDINTGVNEVYYKYYSPEDEKRY